MFYSENTADKANEQNMQNLLPPKPQTLDEMRRSSTPVPTTAAWHTCRKLMYVQRSAQKGYSVGHWPIPESFWPDLNSPALVSNHGFYYLHVMRLKKVKLNLQSVCNANDQ